MRGAEGDMSRKYRRRRNASPFLLSEVLDTPELLEKCIGQVEDAKSLCRSRLVCIAWSRLIFSEEVADAYRRAAPLYSLPRFLSSSPSCACCGRLFWAARWGEMEAYCSRCSCVTLLPPMRPIPLPVQIKGRVTWWIYGELSTTLPDAEPSIYDPPDCVPSILPEGGGYQCQRRVEGCAWMDASRTNCVRGKLVYKPHMQSDRKVSIRVRARVHACKCGSATLSECASSGECRWTPWGEASEPVFPTP